MTKINTTDKSVGTASILDVARLVPDCPELFIHNIPKDQVAQTWVKQPLATLGGPTNYIFSKDEKVVAKVGYLDLPQNVCTVSEPSRLRHIVSSLVAEVTGQPIPPLLATLNCKVDGIESSAVFDNNNRNAQINPAPKVGAFPAPALMH